MLGVYIFMGDTVCVIYMMNMKMGCLVVFDGILALVGYLVTNSVYAFIYIYIYIYISK